MGLSPKASQPAECWSRHNRQHEVLPHMVVGCRARPEIVADRLQKLGLRFERHDNIRLMSKMAFGMFDTRKSHKCVPHLKIGHNCLSALLMLCSGLLSVQCLAGTYQESIWV